MEFSVEKSKETGINFAAFNQSATRFTLATKSGYVIYSISPNVEKYFEDSNGCARSNVEMFEDTALVGLIGTGEDLSVSQRKVFLYNMQSEANICTFSHPTAVISLKFTKDFLIFVLENEINVYKSDELSDKPYVIKTYTNSKGLCALSGNGQIIAYPCPNPDTKEKGTVALHDCKNREVYCSTITGHTEPIAALALNSRGDLLATTSTRGTTIRVFSVPDGIEQFAFRRGSTPANVTSISFSADSSLICVSSDKPTIHIFSLHKPDPKEESVFSAYIPTYLSTVWDSHPMIRLPSATRSISAISKDNRRVYVITEDGYFYIYELDTIKGGVCEYPSEKVSISITNFLTQSITPYL